MGVLSGTPGPAGTDSVALSVVSVHVRTWVPEGGIQTRRRRSAGRLRCEAGLQSALRAEKSGQMFTLQSGGSRGPAEWLGGAVLPPDRPGGLPDSVSFRWPSSNAPRYTVSTAFELLKILNCAPI